MSIFNKGDAVQILPDSTFVGGIKVPTNLIGIKLFIIEVRKDNSCRLSRSATSTRSIGSISMDYLTSYDEVKAGFNPYIILTTEDTKTVTEPTVKATIKETLPKGKLFTIIDEDNGYGRLKNNRGWVDLTSVTKLN